MKLNELTITQAVEGLKKKKVFLFGVDKSLLEKNQAGG